MRRPTLLLNRKPRLRAARSLAQQALAGAIEAVGALGVFEAPAAKRRCLDQANASPHLLANDYRAVLG